MPRQLRCWAEPGPAQLRRCGTYLSLQWSCAAPIGVAAPPAGIQDIEDDLRAERLRFGAVAVALLPGPWTPVEYDIAAVLKGTQGDRPLQPLHHRTVLVQLIA